MNSLNCRIKLESTTTITEEEMVCVNDEKLLNDMNTGQLENVCPWIGRIITAAAFGQLGSFFNLSISWMNCQMALYNKRQHQDVILPDEVTKPFLSI